MFLLMLLGLGYSLTSIAQAACGNFPAVPIILPLSLENYFVWQALIIIPWIILSWLLISLMTRVILGLLSRRPVSFRQVLVLMGLGFASSLFILWMSHLLTAILCVFGMSQKKWVDLLSQPGWFQTLYLVLIVVAVLTGWAALSSSLIFSKMAGKKDTLLTAALGFWSWLGLLAIILR